jgi:fucose 4-O-acetylase-like acetyltransferase
MFDMKRAFYIDNLRIFLTILVIVHHTAIAYGASGGWCYIAPETVKGAGMIAMSSMLAVNQAFFMSLFFFISAFFTAGSIDRKGTGKFMKDRVIRLGIPLLLTMVFINPSLLYGIALYTDRTSASWSEYVWRCVTQYPNASHMWFVLALLIFESAYVIYRIIYKKSVSEKLSEWLPGNLNILVFIVACSLIAFGIRQVYPIGGKNLIGLQLGYFGLYTIFYMLGIVAGRKQWMEKLSFQQARLWGIVAFAAIPLIVLAWISLINDSSLFEQFVGGPHWRSLALATWESVVCLGLSYFLLMTFKKFINKSDSFFTEMAANSYSVYFIHPVIVVGLTILFEKTSFVPSVKFALVSLFSIAICFAFSFLIRKIPGVKRVL